MGYEKRIWQTSLGNLFSKSGKVLIQFERKFNWTIVSENKMAWFISLFESHVLPHTEEHSAADQREFNDKRKQNWSRFLQTIFIHFSYRNHGFLKHELWFSNPYIFPTQFTHVYSCMILAWCTTCTVYAFSRTVQSGLTRV